MLFVDDIVGVSNSNESPQKLIDVIVTRPWEFLLNISPIIFYSYIPNWFTYYSFDLYLLLTLSTHAQRGLL